MSGPQRPESREPGTEAGRALLEYDVTETLDGRFEVDTAFLRGLPAAILAIEAEARAAERTETAGLREALRDANSIIEMTRAHLLADHPDCAYAGLGVMNDGQRRALAADPRPPEPLATGPVPTPEAPTAVAGPRDGSEGG